LKGKFFIPFVAAFLILTPLFYIVDYNYTNLQGSSVSTNILPLISQNDEKKEHELLKIDSTPQKILLTGDSMADGIKIFLKKYSDFNGHQLVGNGWTSSTTGAWSEKKKLKYLVQKYSPTYIIIALGSNELFAMDLERREKYVTDIMEQTTGVKCIWVGPPNWKEDKGFNDMLKRVIGEKKFFASKEIFLKEPLKNKRGSDKKHPNMEGYKLWMDKLAEWIMNSSDYPILLIQPIK